MRAYLRLFVDLMRLRAVPADLPGSPPVFFFSLFLALSLALLQGGFVFPLPRNLVAAGAEAGFVLLFVYAVLWLGRRSPAFMRTATAMLVTITFFRLLQMPVYLLIVFGADDPALVLSILAALYLLGLLMYALFVIGHIFKYALERNMMAGLLVALLYLAVDAVLKWRVSVL